MSNEEIKLLVGFVSTVIIPFIVSYIKKCAWADAYKLGVAVVTSAVAGVITSYIAGDINKITEGKWVTLGITIWGASTIFYHTAFKGMGLEDWINPPKNNKIDHEINTRARTP